jgi:hypothetical protein
LFIIKTQRFCVTASYCAHCENSKCISHTVEPIAPALRFIIVFLLLNKQDIYFNR